MRKGVLLFLVAFSLMAALLIVSLAHSGDTDVNGGHYNRSTGEYHYHHGYSAHSHYDMDGDGDIDCPYEFEDKTNHNSSPSAKPRETTKVKDTTKVIETAKSAPKKSESFLEVLFVAGLYWLMGYCISCFLIIIVLEIWKKVKKGKVSNEAEDEAQKVPKFVAIACALLYLIIKLIKR